MKLQLNTNSRILEINEEGKRDGVYHPSSFSSA
jgi:hypothetical protein